MSMEPVICILQQKLLLIFFKYFFAVKPAILCRATSLLLSKSMSVSSVIPRKSVSVFSFVIPFLWDN